MAEPVGEPVCLALAQAETVADDAGAGARAGDGA